MAKLNTAPLSGMRDFLPTAVLQRKHVVAIIEHVYQQFGFEPLETPAIERLSTLLGKYGEEGDQLLFRVLKRGADLQRTLAATPSENGLADAGLRYDLTVPLARVVAEYQSQLPRVFKRYQIQPVFRADRPARGRYREFFQCDVDIVGSKETVAEAEVIAAVALAIERLGFSQPGEFTIRLNHRGVLRALMEVSSVPAELEGQALVAVDKLDKIGASGVREELVRRGIAGAAADRLLEILDGVPADGTAALSWLGSVLTETGSGPSAVADLASIADLVTIGPAEGRLRIDPSLARGLSYYTGPIFEVEFPGLGISAGGGGRYDGLIGMFSGQAIPAVGFSLGLERILLLMEERGLFPERLSGMPEVLVTQFDRESAPASGRIAALLRAAGLRVDLYPGFERYGPQFQYAEKRQIRYAVLAGPRERDAGVVAVRDLATGIQEDVAEPALAEWLRTRLAATDEPDGVRHQT